MYKLLQKPDFEKQPKVRSISLCSDISEVKNLRLAREELIENCKEVLEEFPTFMEEHPE